MSGRLFLFSLLLFYPFVFSSCFKKYVLPKKEPKQLNKNKKKSKVIIKKNKAKKNSPIIYYDTNIYESVDDVVNILANQLLKNISYLNQKQNKIIITSFVDLNNFSKTTPIGRILSETLINELYIRKFNVIDFRMQSVIVLNKDGEFILSRDISKLTNEIPSGLILVGTYTKLTPRQILINVRIIDNETFEVLSTAKVNLKINNCKLLDNCCEIHKCTKEKANLIPIQSY